MAWRLHHRYAFEGRQDADQRALMQASQTELALLKSFHRLVRLLVRLQGQECLS